MCVCVCGCVCVSVRVTGGGRLTGRGWKENGLLGHGGIPCARFQENFNVIPTAERSGSPRLLHSTHTPFIRPATHFSFMRMYYVFLLLCRSRKISSGSRAAPCQEVSGFLLCIRGHDYRNTELFHNLFFERCCFFFFLIIFHTRAWWLKNRCFDNKLNVGCTRK